MESGKSPSPPQCPYTVTVRRNPPRKAKATPSTNAPDRSMSSPSAHIRDIPPFPLQDILQEPHPLPPPSHSKPSQHNDVSETLRVFLRIRPLDTKTKRNKNPSNPRLITKALPQKKDNEKKRKKNHICLIANDSRSVTLTPPPSLIESKRLKTEIYDGFSHVFSPDSLQEEVYEKVMDPLVTDFIGGKSGLLAAMGPTGSGKTHTVFGCPREPGMVPRALRRLFNHSGGNGDLGPPRSYYLSIFEINSERGKGEKILDLCPDGADLSFQQSTIKGVQEVLISNVVQAECLIAHGMLKRATAATNTNNQSRIFRLGGRLDRVVRWMACTVLTAAPLCQPYTVQWMPFSGTVDWVINHCSASGRSQCIINIRSIPKMNDEKVEFFQNNAILTIIDLAGAERERRTGNKGVRLLESNFINNTSMVFGLCLRSLLEHQKNPKKQLQKHFQNSLLTRHLRDYLQGKKRMTLLLTVKPGEDDYLDTSILLRQASPYMKIKFSNIEEISDIARQKRRAHTMTRIEKRMKCNDFETSVLDETKEVEVQRIRRSDRIMGNFSKALWNVLKQYKQKLEVSENEVQHLNESLRKENSRVLELEKELNDLKSHCLFCRNPSTVGFYTPRLDAGTQSCETGSPSSRETSDMAVVDSSLSTEDISSESSQLPSATHGVSPCRNQTPAQSSQTQLPSETHGVSPWRNQTPAQGSQTQIPRATHGVSPCRKRTPAQGSQTQLPSAIHEDSPYRNQTPAQSSQTQLPSATHGVSPCTNLTPTQSSQNQVPSATHGVSPCGNQTPAQSSKPKLPGATHGVSPSTYQTPAQSSQDPVPSATHGVSSCRNQTPAQSSQTQFPDSRVSPDQDVGSTDSCHVIEVPKRENKQDSFSKPLKVDVPKREIKHESFSKPVNVEKPRRRLLPASTMLLKEINGFDLVDDNPKNSRKGREKKVIAEEKGRSQGSISLARLLTSNLHL
ncbi:ATP binding microtubule motor family protein isoform X2 [Tasmannia lanceolata]|uniref:ATP binding microtubule motor family protein isoform X2 n=1 Tax=Tasmannia lanceolata TaxID=3420 RepID=UPI004063E525